MTAPTAAAAPASNPAPARPVNVRVSAGGAVAGAHPLAKPGPERRDDGGYVVRVDSVPAAIHVHVVAAAFRRATVRRLERAGWRIDWRRIADLPPGAIVDAAESRP